MRTAWAQHGFRRDLYIMTSTGGVATAARAERLPISTVLSGPAGGVAAAVHLGADLGIAKHHHLRHGRHLDRRLPDRGLDGAGHQRAARSRDYANRTPQIEINAVGAGGGSIAWLDAGDMLMVGPQSAGAVAGPGLLRPRRHGADGHRRQSGR